MNEKEQYWEIRLERVKKALEANGMEALVVAMGEDARRKVLEMIDAGATVGLGGSRTVQEIGLLETLRKGDYALHDQYREGLSREASMDIRKQGTHAEYFISGSNAITDDGKIVNTDGLGNRLAGLCFGPGRVIIVAGRNKIVPDLDAAFDRIKNVAAPMNARRFGVKTPCVQTGRCTDCDSPERICNLTLIIERQRMKGRMIVILVNEDLGF
jgi:L-lactate utilization protein LutB